MSVTAGFPAAEMGRLSECLTRLMPHLRQDDVAVTGGVAIQLEMADATLERPRETIEDLDLVAASIDAVVPSATESFLVSHYHVVQPGVPKFMIQLVDPLTRIRVDVFPDLVGSLRRARALNIGNRLVPVLAPADIREHKLQTISKASRSNPVDPKHARDARALGALFDRAVPDVAPDCLVEDIYAVEEQCRRCELSLSPSFPLAPKAQIGRLLGWAPQPS